MGLKKRKRLKKTVINEYDQNPAKNIQKKYRRKKRKRRMRLLMLSLIIIGICYYFSSPNSRLNEITITGNQYVNSNLLKEQLSYTENSIRCLTFSSKIKKELNQVSGVKSVKVKKQFLGGLKITITENTPIAYHQGDTIQVIFDSGETLEITDEALIKKIQVLPRLSGFDQEHLNEFVANYIQVSESVRSQLSDIIFEPLETDCSRVKLVSNDSKISYVRIEDMVYQLENYNLVISQNPNDCYFDYLKGHVYKRSCD